MEQPRRRRASYEEPLPITKPAPLMDTFVVNPAGVFNLSDDELLRLCVANKEIFIERDARGNLVFAHPAGAATSIRNVQLTTEVGLWNEARGIGIVFGSDAGFHPPQRGNAGAGRLVDPAR